MYEIVMLTLASVLAWRNKEAFQALADAKEVGRLRVTSEM